MSDEEIAIWLIRIAKLYKQQNPDKDVRINGVVIE